MASKTTKETDLYGPIKQVFEAQGYEVKGEIGAADLVGVRGDEDPVIVELKTGFSLSLFHQAIERQAISDHVYVAVPLGKGKPFHKALSRNIALCRRLGIGLITVREKDQLVQLHLDPGPYKPRQSKTRKTRLLKEFAKRVGDPNLGGATRQGLMTAYRQDALKCLKILHEQGPSKGSVIAQATGVETATRLMADDHYGWFERVSVGIYQVTPKGIEAIKEFADQLVVVADFLEKFQNEQKTKITPDK